MSQSARLRFLSVLSGEVDQSLALFLSEDIVLKVPVIHRTYMKTIRSGLPYQELFTLQTEVLQSFSYLKDSS